MQNGYYQVTGAMMTQFQQLDITANNLANVNTQGFKRDSLIIGDFERLYQQKRDELELKNHTKESAKFFNRTINRVPRVVEEHTDFSEGSIRRTDNTLDIALMQRDLFFAVLTPDGIKLTQQSSFKLDPDGKLVSSDGYKVLPKNFLTTTNKDITINSKDGKISINENGEIFQNNHKIADIFIGRVKNLNELKKSGDKLYTLDGIEDKLTKVDSGNLVRQGYIQMSNVNAINEMTSLIETNRLVEMYQKVMTSHMDDLNKDAITKLASTRA